MSHDKEIIRDQTVDELEEQRDQQFLVKITGPHGTPVHYHASLKDDGYNTTSLNENFWVVDLKSNNDAQDAAVPFNSIEKLEFRLGGKVVKRFQMNRLICRVLSNFDEKRQMGSAIIEDRLTNHPSIAYFIALIGSPCPSKQEYLTQGVPFLQNYLAETIRSSNANEDIQDLDKSMIITQLFFERSEINGIMSLLKNIGVDTARETPPPSISTPFFTATTTAILPPPRELPPPLPTTSAGKLEMMPPPPPPTTTTTNNNTLTAATASAGVPITAAATN